MGVSSSFMDDRETMVIFVDVNKTILMHDKAKRMDSEKLLNRMMVIVIDSKLIS